MVGLGHLTTVKRFKPYLIVLAISSAVILLPFGIVNATNYSMTINIVLDVILVIFLLGLIVFSTYYGRKLLEMVKAMATPSNVFLKKVLNVHYDKTYLIIGHSILAWN
jgi:hypothetical protein